jgi:hypothetical protein
MERGGWRRSVLVEEDSERGKSTVEGRRRCRVLWGRVLPFIGMGEELQGGGNGGGMPK